MKKSIYSEEHRRIVEKLKQARESAGMTQIEAAERLGRSQSFISKVETGQTRVDLVQLNEFAKLYGKKIEFFLSAPL